MASTPNMYIHGGISYLHEKYELLGDIIWRIPSSFGVSDETDYGFEVLRERTLRFGAKAYELADIHTHILNAVITGSLGDRDKFITHDRLYSFLNVARDQTRPLNPEYLHRALKAYDGVMRDATGTDEPFFERGKPGTGHPIRLRLNPRIGIEDSRTPRDYDLPFD